MRWRRERGLLLGGGLLLLPWVAGAQPSVPCRDNLRGTVQTTQVTEGCTSAVGLCFEGVLESNSPLRGTTFFVADSVAPVEGAPGQLRYTGTLFLTLASGRVVSFASTGVLDTATGTFQETDVAEGPLEATLHFTGTTNATLSGFSGQLSGELCGGPALLDVPHGPRG